MSYFYCLGESGQPVMMVYNHFTGRFSPIVTSFSSQPFIGISQNFQFKLAPTGSKTKQSQDPCSQSPPSEKKSFENTISIRKPSNNPSDGQAEDQDSEYDGRQYSAQFQKRKKKSGLQNENRNIIPNIIQQIFSFLSKAKKSRLVCEKAFAHYLIPAGSAYSIRRFYIYHKLIKENMNHYVNQQALSIFQKPNSSFSHVFSEEEQRYYLQITRVMILYFLNNISPLLTIKSRRMGKQRRLEHLKVRRYIISKLGKPTTGYLNKSES